MNIAYKQNILFDCDFHSIYLGKYYPFKNWPFKDFIKNPTVLRSTFNYIILIELLRFIKVCKKKYKHNQIHHGHLQIKLKNDKQ